MGFPPGGNCGNHDGVKTLITLLFLPLGLTFLWLGWLAVLAWRRRHVGGLFGGVGAVLIAMPLAFLLVCSLPITAQGLQGLLVNSIAGRQVQNPETIDAIIVLTGGMTDAGPVGWLPRAESIHRLAVAYELQRTINLRLPVIVSGGFTAGAQAPSEARVVADFFARNRSEVTPTELEEVSTDTAESALQLAPVLHKRSVRDVLLVTSDIHMPRALAAFRARGIDPIPAPALSVPHERGLQRFLPSARALVGTSAALTELYGIVGYMLTGKISWADLTYPQG